MASASRPAYTSAFPHTLLSVANQCFAKRVTTLEWPWATTISGGCPWSRIRGPSSPDHDGESAHLPAFRWLTLYTFLSPLYVFMTDWNPIGLVLAQSASSVLSLPVMIFIIPRLTADRKLMGKHANGWLTNIILVAAALTAVYLGFQAGAEFLQGSG